MFHEFSGVRQEPGPGRRRWFGANGVELFFWYDADGDVIGFQLCYDLGDGLHALTWRLHLGFAHHAVDDGEFSRGNLTPILVSDGAVPWPEIIRLFEAQSESLEPALRQLVRVQLHSAGGHPR